MCGCVCGCVCGFVLGCMHVLLFCFFSIVLLRVVSVCVTLLGSGLCSKCRVVGFVVKCVIVHVCVCLCVYVCVCDCVWV